MKFILGTKEKMTQVFDENGRALPGTVISAGPVFVSQVKTPETDGYASVQVAFGEQKESRLTKSVLGHLKKAGVSPHKTLKEFRVEEVTHTLGDSIDVSVFSVGDMVTVRGVTKGKGFQGGVKRHGFHGGPRTHGQKHNERSIGSIGGGGRAGWRVVKGKKMPGRMGSDTVSVKNLRVLAVFPEEGTLIVSGAVPGRRGTLLEIVSE